MNAKLILLCLLSASTALAADSPSLFDSTTTSMMKPIPLNGYSPWRSLLTQRHEPPHFMLGKSDFALNSPLIDGWRPLPHVEGLSRTQRFLRLPVIRLFVPGPMERPSGAGKYFKWRDDDSDIPWSVASSRAGIMKGPVSIYSGYQVLGGGN